MSIYDNFISNVEKVGANVPVSDENGQLTSLPAGKFNADPNYKVGQYENFFESVNEIAGEEVIQNPAKLKAKDAIEKVIDIMSDNNLSYWLEDANTIAACKKIKVVLEKIILKI